MAITVRGATKTDYQPNPTTGTGTINCASPAGTVAGDYLVAIIGFNEYQGVYTVGIPAGWTMLGTFLNTAYGYIRMAIAYHKVVAGDPTTWTFKNTTTSGNASPMGVSIIGVAGATGFRLGTPYGAGNTSAKALGVASTFSGQTILVAQDQYSINDAFNWVRADSGAITNMDRGTQQSYHNSCFWAYFVTPSAGASVNCTATSPVNNSNGWQIAVEENTAPNAPTQTNPPNESPIDLAATNRLEWLFSDPDPGDSQSKFDLRWWNLDANGARVGAANTVSQSVPNTFWDAPAGTFSAGRKEWQVCTYDSKGVVGPYSGSSFFTAATAPPSPTITAPVSGSTVAASALVTWSTPNQDSYQLRRVADNAGVPDESIVYFDTLEVPDSSVRSLSVDFTTNNRWEWVQVRSKYSGLWSQWYSVRLQVVWKPPPVPVVTVTTVDLINVGYDHAIRVDIVNPDPVGDEPATSYNNVYVSAIDIPEWRLARFVLVNGYAIFHTPRSGVEYLIRVEAVAANGTISEGVG